jgi:DNA-binding NarL/FixJ family response regulator
MDSNVRVVIADDHELFRSGLIALLRSVDGIEVVGEADTGDRVIATAQQLQPDVVVLDVEMPGNGARWTVRAICETCAHTRVVVLTMHDDPALIRDLIRSGASAYLLKRANRAELAAAIRLAARADDMVLVSTSRDSFAGLTRHRGGAGEIVSVRESQVLGLIGQAKTNHEIARSLSISEGTVKRHLSNIYAKLGATSRVDAVRKATSAGLLGHAPHHRDHPARLT